MLTIGACDFTAQKHRIAIIDDERALCDLYSLVLKKRGYEPVFAGNGGEEILDAIENEELTQNNLDIVLLDYHMGEGKIDGFETANRIRKSIPLAKIIIVSADSKVKRKVLAAGFSFISKPFSIREFLTVVARPEDVLQEGKHGKMALEDNVAGTLVAT